MRSVALTDDADVEGDDRGDLWVRVGRKAVARELDGARHDVDTALHDVAVDTMYHGEDPTPEQVRAARRALNEARARLEESVAPAAGVEPWGDPPADVPMGVLWELTNHPKADGVDPREYLDEGAGDE